MENEKLTTNFKANHNNPNSLQEATIDEDELVNYINATLKLRDKPYYEIGKRLLEEYYNGDPEQVSNKSSKKIKSLRKIVNEKVVGASFTEIHRMIRVTIQDNFFKQLGVDVSLASFSQKVELLSLPNDNEKITLIQKAIGESLSVRNLRSEVQKVKAQSEAQKNNEPGKLSRALPKLLKILEDLDPLVESIAGDLQALDLQAMSRICDEVHQGQNLLRELGTKFFSLIQALEDNMKSASIWEPSSVVTSIQQAQEDCAETALL